MALTMTIAEKVKSLFNILLNIVVVLAVIITLLSVGSYLCTGKSSILGYKIMHVQSPSMEPIIMTGDYIIGKTVKDPEDIIVGEIYTYNYHNQYTVTHRIIDITSEGYIFKGDNNKGNDPEPVQFKNIIYKVIKY